MIVNGEAFTVVLETLSDWHTGTGQGRTAAIDAACYRDADGFPAVRGKTAANLLRDCAEHVSAALGGDWDPWVTAIFGRDRVGVGPPVAAALQAGPLRIAADARKFFAASRTATSGPFDPFFVVRAAVGLDGRRAAVREKLRFIELARAGIELRAEWTVTLPGVDAGERLPDEAVVVLVAAARLLERLGGRRRRGSGRCRMLLLDASGTEVGLPEAPNSPTSVPSPGGSIARPRFEAPGGDGAAGTLEKRAEIRIVLDSPVIADAGTRNNMVLTHRYLPGSLLVPIVAGSLDSARPGIAQDLIQRGMIRVTDATLEIEGVRSVPAPRSLQVDKRGDDDTVHVGTHADADPSAGRKGLDSYCTRIGDELVSGLPDLVQQVHGSIDDTTQRPSGLGGMFVYQALSAGTCLRAEVYLPAGIAIDHDVLSGRHQVGRSSKDDYGAVTIEVLNPREDAPRSLPTVEPGGRIEVLLTSDTLLRDEQGRPATTVDSLRGALQKALSCELADPESGDRPTALLGMASRQSWQRSWGLPRPTLTAVAAGSVAIFTALTAVTAQAQHEVELSGLGDRRAEGYGCVQFAAPFGRRATWHLREREKDTNDRNGGAGEAVQPAGVQPPWWGAVERAGVTEHVRLEALRAAQDPTTVAQLVPPRVGNAQLGSLRAAAESGSLHQWLGTAIPGTPRHQAWAPVLGESGGLQQLIMSAQAVWSILGVDPPAQDPDDTIAAATRRLLIVHVARSAAKAATE